MKLYYNVEFESLNVKIDYTYHVKTWHVKAGDQLGWIGSHSNFGFQHWRIRLFDSGSTLQRRSKNSEWVYSTHLFVHIWRLPKLLYYRIRVIIGWLVWSRREFKPPDYHHYYSNKMSLLMLALHCIYSTCKHDSPLLRLWDFYCTVYSTCQHGFHIHTLNIA